MKRYTLRGLIHDAKIFNQLRLEFRRTKKERRKEAASDWLSRYLAATKATGCELEQSPDPQGSNRSRQDSVPVTITGTYDFSTFPNVAGTFTTSGGLTISGITTMKVGLIGPNGLVAHCVVTLIPYDNSGTIVIDQQCQFATSMPAPYPTGQGKGRWKIVSGTGAYANLFGNGSLTMPTNAQGFPQEAMTGYIHQ